MARLQVDDLAAVLGQVVVVPHPLLRLAQAGPYGLHLLLRQHLAVDRNGSETIQNRPGNGHELVAGWSLGVHWVEFCAASWSNGLLRMAAVDLKNRTSVERVEVHTCLSASLYSRLSRVPKMWASTSFLDLASARSACGTQTKR